MLRKSFVLAVVGLGMSACNLIGDPTNSGFTTPTNDGTIVGKVNTSPSRSASERSTITGNVYGYQVGAVKGDGLQGFAGIASGATVSAPLASGSATMNGTFRVGAIQNVSQNGTSFSGLAFNDVGALTLVADFDAQTLTGSGTGEDGAGINSRLNNNVLEIDGRFNGSTLSGTATYDGVSGPLQGLVGANEAIGAFHGHTDGAVHAGGFIVN